MTCRTVSTSRASPRPRPRPPETGESQPDHFLAAPVSYSMSAPSNSSMEDRISNENGFLRAELFDRETADETRKFLQSVVPASIDHRRARVLVHVRLSRAR